MTATVLGVSFMDNDWKSEIDQTLDILNLPNWGGEVTNLNVLVKVAGSDPPPSVRVSLNSYEPGSRVRSSIITFADLDLPRMAPGEVPFALPGNVTAYRGSVTNLDFYIKDSDARQEVVTVARGGGTSDLFFRTPLLKKGWLCRGIGRQPKSGPLDMGNALKQEPASMRLFEAGGVEVIEAAVQPQNGLVIGSKGTQWAFVRSAADVFYYSGHGAFWDGNLILPNHEDWISPETLLNFWRRQPQGGKGAMDLDVLFIAGCSVLYIDFDNPNNGFAHGRRWAELLTNRKGPLVALLGYGAGKEAPPSPRGGKAPADSDGKGHQVGNLIAQRMAQAIAGGLPYKEYVTTWLEVNRNAGIFSAIGIDVWDGYRDAMAIDKPRKL
jgi:hypothetical protein